MQVEVDHDGVVGVGEGAAVDYHGDAESRCSPTSRSTAPTSSATTPSRSRRSASGWPQRRRNTAPKWRSTAPRLAPQHPGGCSASSPADAADVLHDRIDSVEGTANVRAAPPVRGPEGRPPRPRTAARGGRNPRAADRRQRGLDDRHGAAAHPGARRARRRVREADPCPATTSRLPGLRDLNPPAVILDESCRDLAAVAPARRDRATGSRSSSPSAAGSAGLRMIHAARALELKVMLGCMIESKLGIAQAAALGRCVDYVDLDGHLLNESQPYRGPRIARRPIRAVRAPGLGVEPTMASGSRSSPAVSFRHPHARPRHGSSATASATSIAVDRLDARRAAADQVDALRAARADRRDVEEAARSARTARDRRRAVRRPATPDWRSPCGDAIDAGWTGGRPARRLVGGPGAVRRRRAPRRDAA